MLHQKFHVIHKKKAAGLLQQPLYGCFFLIENYLFIMP